MTQTKLRLMLLLSVLLPACGGADAPPDAPVDEGSQGASEEVQSPKARGSMQVVLDGKKMISEEPEVLQQGRWGAKEDMLHLVIRGHVEGDFGYQVGGPNLQFDIYMRPAATGSHEFRQQVRKTSNDGLGVCLQVTGPDLPVLHGMTSKGTFTVTAIELEGDTNDTLVVKRFAASFDGAFKHSDPHGDGPTSQATGSIEYTR